MTKLRHTFRMLLAYLIFCIIVPVAFIGVKLYGRKEEREHL